MAAEKRWWVRIVLLLGLCQTTPGVQQQQPKNAQMSPCSHLEQALVYESSEDPRAEQEFRLSLAGRKSCPDAYLMFSAHLGRELRFQEAADLLDQYIKQEHRGDWQNLRNWQKKDLLDLRNAARLKALVQAATKPALDDLVQLTHLVSGFGARQAEDAMPYARQALELYHNSAAALLSYADLMTFAVSPHPPAPLPKGEGRLFNTGAPFSKPSPPTSPTGKGVASDLS